MTLDIDHLRRWIGRIETDSEVLTVTKARQFDATLDRTSDTAPGAPAPLLIHLCLAQPIAPMSALGRDGHPALGGFLPPVPLPRRMWAGGAFSFHAPIRIGATVTRRSTITDVQVKQGRTGPLCFVTLSHEITSDGAPALTERQDIVYREARSAATSLPPAAAPGLQSRSLMPTPTLLFRYSALTFNGHRIHYDTPFATGTEGYPGLIVHGPLQATLLCHYAQEIKGMAPKHFRFRSLSPLFYDAEVTLNAEESAEGLRLWTARPGGPVAMEATAVF